MNTITGKEYPLLNIFSNQFEFYIPEYQRPYAWTEAESCTLFDDLFKHYSEGWTDNFFLGSVVLIKNVNDPHSDVIDGQQRLTTLSILFACLGRRLRSDAKAFGACQELLLGSGNVLAHIPERPRVNLRSMDQPFFNKYIQNIDIEALLKLDPKTLDTEAQQHIQANCAILDRRFETVFGDDTQKLLDFSGFMLNRCFLVVVYTASQDSAFRIFSVMNSRGLDLLPIDIIKSEVIGQLNKSDMHAYTDKWEQLENDCGREGFNEVFTHVRSIFAKERPRRTLLEEFREYVLKYYSPKGLIDNVIEPYAKAYLLLKQQAYVATANAEKINDILYWLNKLSNYDWMPPAIKFFAEHGQDTEYTLWFVRKLERLAACLLATSKDVNQRFDRYKWILAEMDSRPSHCLAEPLQLIELTPQEKKAFLSVLDGEIYTMQVQRRNYLIQRIDSFYSDGGAHYDAKIFTIEHVLPQNIAPGSEWERVWPDTEQRAHWLNRLANLIPLTRRINSSAQNYDFDTKKAKYFLSKDGTTSYCLATQIVNYHAWTAEDCESRQRELIEKLTKCWELSVSEAELNVDSKEKVFHIASRGSNASGHAGTGKVFVVNAGSVIAQDTLASMPANYAALRDSLMADGSIVDNTFICDVQFESPSAAAAVILGRAANGPREWSTLDGRDYSQIIGH